MDCASKDRGLSRPLSASDRPLAASASPVLRSDIGGWDGGTIGGHLIKVCMTYLFSLSTQYAHHMHTSVLYVSSHFINSLLINKIDFIAELIVFYCSLTNI